jgi:peptide/nickel transport system substrate-binding protein
MKKSSCITVCFAVVFFIFVLPACRRQNEGGESDTAVRSKDTLVISLGSECCSGNLDPTQKSGKAYDFFHTGLMKIGQNLQAEPDLCTGYTLSPDNSTYTFTLRKDVSFSDGSGFSADDVIFTYRTAKESGLSINLTAMKEVTAVDPYTVKIVLAEPDSTFLINTAYLGIVPHTGYEKSTYSNNPVGTGKYRLVRLDSGQKMTMKANEYYYGDKPKIENVTVLALNDNMVLAWVKSGSVDLAYIPPDQASVTLDGYHTLSCSSLITEFINLPTTKITVLPDGTTYGNNVTCDPAVRQALNIGINRKELVQNVLNGYGSPAYILCSGTSIANQEPAFTDGNTQEAAQILQKAGWTDSDGDGIREKNGVKASFVLNGSAADTGRYNLAVAVAQQAAQFGIEITAKSTDWSTCKKDVRTTPNVYKSGNYEPMDMYRYGYSKAGGVSYFNPSYYANTVVDTYIEQALEASPEHAVDYWKKAQYDGKTGINIDIPYLSLVSCDDTYYCRNGLDTCVQRPHDINHGGYSIIYNIEDWEWKD